MAKKVRFFILAPVLFILGVLIFLISGRTFLNQKKVEIGCWCSHQENETGDFKAGEKVAFFEGKEIQPLLGELTEPKERVMGVTTEDRWIEIDLLEQKLTAWEGERVFFETPISSGKWYPTPTGEFTIWSKFKYTKMEGGVWGTGTYYYLPNVPYTMYFYNGFGLHGTYWHNNFGNPMSHGCVNLPTLAAEKIFYWSGPVLPFGSSSARATKENPGTKVVIHH